MRRSLPILILSLSCVLAACGGAEEPVPADPLSLHLETGEFTVPAGESFMCFYTDTITDRELSVVSAAAKQASGGHHLTVYYVDNQRPVGAEPCSGTAEMVDWHFVVGGGGEAGGNIVQLAEGLAIKIPAGKQLMIQAHYINTTGAELAVSDDVTVKLADPADVKAYAGDFVVIDDTFEIPPHAAFETTSVCELKQDTKLTMLLGHMHEHGVRYTLERVDEQGSSLEMLREHDWLPEYAGHPPIATFTMDAPLLLPAGTRLRQTCSWNNTTSSPLLFPTEMCIAFGYYFPGESRLECERMDVQP